ncbi:DNA-binding transcriptional regulator TyrR [Vibrio sp. UCD-FRSSP16_10]|uniref:transcriptional regulator TyrR n=1 Tax=unclassified Vibrio TaxID=2614977 RepID=UPI0007FDCDA1|nr:MULTISPECIES: transcriptional regulator TyrR [unclassified Vibrio]OBT13168.1 DNA-binding transcriptional regulator TyrR [Vibrio sp. UCD-FRSSP16_30]OBT19569.1 DNA-binding transcriptional regulator TyrR [Vibrio sp. UCD-FRSSP16_10]
MRLEVLCEDRLGLTRELLDILTSQQINLRGIELDPKGIIYLNCPELDFDSFSALMAQIRRIEGVSDVRRIQFMPSERKNTELTAVLDNLSEALLSVCPNGQINMANQKAKQLFHSNDESLLGSSIMQLLPKFAYQTWLEESGEREKHTLVINGIDYQMEVIPVHLQQNSDTLVHASTVFQLRQSGSNAGCAESVADHDPLGFEHFVGISNRHKALITQAKKLSMLEQPLLIEGDTGTGKEMLARACHARSHRAHNPFIVLSCASMPDDVAETELFGHAESAFKQGKPHKGIFENADGGTVFLDEIGEMSPHLQSKLLRFLQDGTFRRVGEDKEVSVDVRVIASTKHTLEQLIELGTFRQDLYFRLNVLNLKIPPLRERTTDIAPLLDMLLLKHSTQLALEKPTCSATLMDALISYTWPGNIRELDNAALRALTELEGNELSTQHFHLPTLDSLHSTDAKIDMDGSLDQIMKRHESQILDKLYQAFPSSRKLAKRLNVSHTSIANKLRDYEIGKK